MTLPVDEPETPRVSEVTAREWIEARATFSAPESRQAILALGNSLIDARRELSDLRSTHTLAVEPLVRAVEHWAADDTTYAETDLLAALAAYHAAVKPSESGESSDGHR